MLNYNIFARISMELEGPPCGQSVIDPALPRMYGWCLDEKIPAAPRLRLSISAPLYATLIPAGT